MRTLIVIAAAILLVATQIFWAPTASAAPSKGRTVSYTGQLLGEGDTPVSGVFPFTFALYRDAQSKTNLWQESHFVAIVEGKYRARLGSSNPIPERLKLEALHISVSLQGGPELVREPLGPALASEPADDAPPSQMTGGVDMSDAPGARNLGRGNKTMSDYADRAGYAIEAEHAAGADKLEGKTLDQVVDYVQEKTGGKRVRVGTIRKLTGHIGGYGGGTYEEVCPRGYVVIGIRGSAGMYVDGLQVICGPLELE